MTKIYKSDPSTRKSEGELNLPPIFGPGSQDNGPDEEKLEYMEMPREMFVFERPIAPEPEDIMGMEAGKEKLEEILVALRVYHYGKPCKIIELSDLGSADLGLVNQVLGEGEVSVVCRDHIQSQETVLAGVWRVLHFDANGKIVRDTIEVGPYPNALLSDVFEGAQQTVPKLDEVLPQNVFNAPSLFAELEENQNKYKIGDLVYSINLSLLPHTEEDLVYLDRKLGKGGTIVLSRGYGNCRVSSTATKNIWWVQYYNSQDALILNSLEVINVPEVVWAAPEDIVDSTERLDEIMDVYRTPVDA